MDHVVELATSDSRPIAAVRFIARQDELPRLVPAACGEVWNYLKAAGVQGAGRHVAIYHDGQIDVEVGAEVPGPFVESDRVHCSAIPAGPVATTAHFGDYSGLHHAHAAVLKWCQDHGRSLAGPNWEIYGHWSDDPAQVRTDVYYLLTT
jgi:effector-binding domain-containing protein